MFYAFCYASGQIEFGHHVPVGTLIVAKTKDTPRAIARLRNRIDVAARHGRPDRTVLLVPGVPEAASQADALEALCDWMNWHRFAGSRKHPAPKLSDETLRARSDARQKRFLKQMCAA